MNIHEHPWTLVLWSLQIRKWHPVGCYPVDWTHCTPRSQRKAKQPGAIRIHEVPRVFLKNWNLAQAVGSILLHLDSIPLSCVYIYIHCIMLVFHPIREDPNSNILVWRRTTPRQLPATSHDLAEMCLQMAEMFLGETQGMHGPFPNGRDSMAAKPSAAASSQEKIQPPKITDRKWRSQLGFKRYTGEITSKAIGFIPQHTSTLVRFPGWSRLRIWGHHQFHRSFHHPRPGYLNRMRGLEPLLK